MAIQNFLNSNDSILKNAMAQIFTIGYTAFAKPDDFIAVLKTFDIKCLIDVRSYPTASEFYAIFSKPTLEALLKTHKIFYRNYAAEFGARQENRAYFMDEGCLDFKKFTRGGEFLSGAEKLEKALSLGYNVALMCAEKDPINCHRNIMIARALSLQGLGINHILADGSLQTQAQMDERLLKFYHLNEASLFQSKDELIDEAYTRKNIEIAYRGREEEAI